MHIPLCLLWNTNNHRKKLLPKQQGVVHSITRGNALHSIVGMQSNAWFKHTHFTNEITLLWFFLRSKINVLSNALCQPLTNHIGVNNVQYFIKQFTAISSTDKRIKSMPILSCGQGYSLQYFRVKHFICLPGQ